MSDDISPKQMDALDEQVREEENYALSNAGNNSPNYVASRYVPMYAARGYPVPVRAGSQFTTPVGRLLPTGTQRDNYGILAAHPAGGIIVRLRDEATGDIGEYHIESNGLNGIEVTGRCD